jgi:LysM repeat protein
MINRILNLMVAAALLVILLAALPAPVKAQAGSAAELIAEVNAYRAQNGLAPYEIDGGLMSVAQSHSEYQASIQKCTHFRADGTSPADHGISAENIACGINLTVRGAIYYQWKDNLHAATILGPTAGRVGAGVAQTGNMVFYTLVVKRISGDFNYNPPANSNTGGSGSSAPQPAAGNIVFSQMVTATPGEDGAIAHVIQYGEMLVNIAEAYGVPLADLIAMNRLDPNNPVYYAGDVLLIRPAFTPTPDFTATVTPRPPTRTPLPTRTPRPTATEVPEQPSATPEPTATATTPPLVRIPTLDDLGPARPVLAYTFIGISAAGLLALALTALIRPRK